MLFVEQFASGTTTVGGDLCVYDTETAKCFRLTETAKERFQICSFDVYGRDCVVFDCVQLDEGYMEIGVSYPVMKVSALHESIEAGKTVDLRG